MVLLLGQGTILVRNFCIGILRVLTLNIRHCHMKQLEVDALVEYDPLAVNQACGIAQSSGNGGEMVIVVVRYQKYTK